MRGLWRRFRVVRNSVGITSTGLSWQVKKLREADYIEARRDLVGRSHGTWLKLRTLGRRRLAAHTAALHKIVVDAGALGEYRQPVVTPVSPLMADLNGKSSVYVLERL
jgi:hypothetical protein